MLFVNGGINQQIGVVKNPLTHSVFVIEFDEGGFPIPPSSSFIVTDPLGDEFVITEGGSKMITE